MKYHDAITPGYSPKAMKHIPTERNDPIVFDSNYLFLRRILNNKGPLTINNILDEYKEDKNEKSIKTIYRYLGKLTDKEMVTKCGKRVYENNKSDTLYGTTAKFFLVGVETNPFTDIEDKDMIKARKILVDFISNVLENNFEGKEIDVECFEKKIMEWYAISNSELIKNIETASEEAINKVMTAEMTAESGRFLMDVIFWLGLIIKKPALIEEIKGCLKNI
jgi:Fe2+ or Zn2+ uptake regulation protein